VGYSGQVQLLEGERRQNGLCVSTFSKYILIL
jgi:hypothetical protein